MKLLRASGATVALVLTVCASAAGATETRIFRAQSAAGFLAGTFDGVSLDAEGRLRPAEPFERLAEIGEPFVFAAAARVGGESAGWVVGTGNSGRVLAIDGEGKVSRLFEVPEPEIFAVAVAADGAVYAGSSPNGKVYRQARGAKPGEFEVVFTPGERYIWGLDFAPDGELLVATGVEGKLFAVDAAGRSRLLVDTDATHLRSLLARPDGTILIGTASDGRVLELSGKDTATLRTLYDSALAEVVGFAVDAGRPGAPAGLARGGVYVAILDSEAGFVETAGATPAPAAAEAEKAEPTVKVEEVATPTRRAGAPKSEIVRLVADGRVEPIRTLATDTVFSLAVHDGRLWLGTGLEGKLLSLRDDGLVLEKDFDERQIVALRSRGGRLAVAVTNGAAMYQTAPTAKHVARGTFTSEVLDAATSSRFGSLRWRGTGAVRFAWRVGNALEPDGTWTEWTPAASAPNGGREFALGALPVARYLQWRAEFAADSTSSLVSAVEIAYRSLNVPPKLRRLSAMDPGEVLVAQNFNPQNQVYEPVHPNRDGMFTTLGATTPVDDGRLKTLWKKGMRTLRWEAEDANQDALVYRLWVRRESESAASATSAASAASAWLPMAEDLTSPNWSFDETALPDGAYRFKVEASDVDANEPGDGATAERVSEPVVVDSTPPRRLSARRDPARPGAWVVEIEDAGNPLRRAEWSADGAAWEPAVAADGMVDSLRETLRVSAPAGARFVVLRVQDAAFNFAVFELAEDRGR